MNSTLAIEAEGLVKEFGKTRAVDGIALTVSSGSVYGVLGPNGAGKTTTIRMLSTLLRPDAGKARVFGHDVVREAEVVRGLVSLTGQFASVDDGLTGYENLVCCWRGFWGIPVPRPRRGRATSSRRSTWSKRVAGWRRLTPVACGAGWISRRALSAPPS